MEDDFQGDDAGSDGDAHAAGSYAEDGDEATIDDDNTDDDTGDGSSYQDDGDPARSDDSDGDVAHAGDDWSDGQNEQYASDDGAVYPGSAADADADAGTDSAADAFGFGGDAGDQTSGSSTYHASCSTGHSAWSGEERSQQELAAADGRWHDDEQHQGKRTARVVSKGGGW